MKKIIMMLAIALSVSITHGAAVSWTTGGIKTPLIDGSFGALVGTTTGIYLAQVAFFADNAGTLGSALTVPGGTSDNSTVSFAGSILNNTTTGYDFLNNGSYWAQVVITSTDGLWSLTSTTSRFTIGGTGNGNLDFLTGGGFNVSVTTLPTSYTAVPEPTSMALVALGIAAVGLRRRFKK